MLEKRWGADVIDVWRQTEGCACYAEKSGGRNHSCDRESQNKITLRSRTLQGRDE
jgi:hypothetical protein